MSSAEEVDLKAGHRPAVKAGGMRITQSKPGHEKPHEAANKTTADEDEEEYVEESTSPPKQQLLISGAPSRGNEDFPTAAVKAIHEKPQPSLDMRTASSKPKIIHQPRK